MSGVASGPNRGVFQIWSRDQGSLAKASRSAARSCRRSSWVSTMASPFSTKPMGSAVIKRVRAGRCCTASQAHSPRSGSTGTPSMPCIRAMTRPSGKPWWMRFARKPAARYSATVLWRGACRPARVLNNLERKAMRMTPSDTSGAGGNKASGTPSSPCAGPVSETPALPESNNTALSQPAASNTC